MLVRKFQKENLDDLFAVIRKKPSGMECLARFAEEQRMGGEVGFFMEVEGEKGFKLGSCGGVDRGVLKGSGEKEAPKRKRWAEEGFGRNFWAGVELRQVVQSQQLRFTRSRTICGCCFSWL